jgi:peptidoglycan hydrolase-like protein with peptidoglycan-binding domain
MTKFFTLLLLTLFVCQTVPATTQNVDSSASGKTGKTSLRKPIFRATSDQIKQAQAILKQRGFYNAEQTGALDRATRDGLKKYQGAETLKVTGTLNKLTLEKMGIVLTDKQKTG